MKEKLKQFWWNFFKFPGYILTHPFDGFDDLKRQKQGKLSVALILIAMLAVFQIVNRQYAGFVVNFNNPRNFNSINEILSVGILVFVFVLANWSTTTLMSGKGSLKEILLVTGYSIWPLLIIGFPNVLFSNIITQNEAAFYSVFQTIGWVLTGIMLFFGLLSIHEYGLFKSIASLLVTALAMAIIVFIGLLFFDIIQQVINFVSQIISELRLR